MAQNGLMAKKGAQMNVYVIDRMKWLYDAASKIGGLDKSRIAAAGFLLLMESPSLRRVALNRLEAFESPDSKFDDKEAIDGFVRGLSEASSRAHFERNLLTELSLADDRNTSAPRPAPKKKKLERY